MKTAAALLKKPGAQLKPVNGEIRDIKLGKAIFSNRSYVFHDKLPSFLQDGKFIFSPMEQTEVVCTSPGVVYVVTPLPDRNRDSVTDELQKQGFETGCRSRIRAVSDAGRTRDSRQCLFGLPTPRGVRATASSSANGES